MKTVRFLLFAGCFTIAFSSCSTLFRPKYGCPSNGANVGAEKLLSDPGTARKAKKFQS